MTSLSSTRCATRARPIADPIGFGIRIRLDDGSYRLREAEVAGAGSLELALTALSSDHRAQPACHRRETVAEAGEERQVHEEPHDPPGQAAEVQPPHAGDRAEPADRRDAARVAVRERQRFLAF